MHNAPSQPGSSTRTLNSESSIKRVIAAFRRLSGGRSVRDQDRRALVACSGGADSAAAAIALERLDPKPVMAHIVHDMRPVPESHADRDKAADLAHTLGCEFVSTEIHTPDSGNDEHNAREQRYQALAQIAASHNLGWVVTGHHADDQLETQLMRLIRGSGPRGMRGIAEFRDLTPSIRLARPLLQITREECEQICAALPFEWAHDSTNDDTSRLRNALRTNVIPELRSIAPQIASSSVRNARAFADTHDALVTLVRTVIWDTAETTDGTTQLSRESLASYPQGIIEPLVRIAIDKLANGAGHDAVSADQIEALSNTVHDDSTERRRFTLGPILINVHASRVTIERR